MGVNDPVPNWWDRFTMWFAANRTPLGGLLSALAILIRSLDDHKFFSAGADFLEHTAALILGASGIGLLAAGQFKSDSYWKERRTRESMGLPERRGTDSKMASEEVPTNPPQD